MPLVKNTTYKAPYWLRNRHLSTMYPNVFRKLPHVPYKRERISTPDQDFLDLDRIYNNSNKAVIICHGLEGSSEATYMRGLATALTNRKIDVVAMNYRSCSGEPNKHLQSYHIGATNDIDVVLKHIENKYDEIYIVGYSLGGNLVLKYNGEKGNDIHPKIKRSVALSVPCDLVDSHTTMDKGENFIYRKRFFKRLRRKALQKKELLIANGYDYEQVNKTESFYVFDDVFTAPINGFKGAIDYYTKNSAINFLDNICSPTLLINALNDTFLTPKCFPYKQAENSKYFYLETPAHGGHCAFISFDKKEEYWMETRVCQFLFEDKLTT